MFAGGVDVAADVEAVLGGNRCWSACRRPSAGSHRAQSGLADVIFVGHTPVSVVNRRTSASRSRQNSSMSRPGCCFVLFLGPGIRGTAASATVMARRNCFSSGSRMAAQIASRPSPLAWLRGVDQRAEGFLRLLGPDRAG